MEPSPQTPRPKILVADYMPAIVELMRKTLEGADYTVLTASSYEEAVAVSHAERPDLIILEWMVPDTPLYLEGEVPNTSSGDSPVTRLARRLFPDNKEAVPPYPIDAFIHRLQSAPNANFPPVILLTSKASEAPYLSWAGVVQRGGLGWFDCVGPTEPFLWLTKPFQPAELLFYVHRFFPPLGSQPLTSNP